MEELNDKIILNKHDLSIADFVSGDESRPVLQHVLVRYVNGRPELVATDGYLAVFHSLTEIVAPFEPFLVPADAFMAAKSTMRKASDVAWLADSCFQVPTQGISLNFSTLVEADKYPDIDRLVADIKHDQAVHTINLDPRLLAKIATFLLKVPGHGTSVSLTLNNRLQAVELSNHVHSYALLMPLKSD